MKQEDALRDRPTKPARPLVSQPWFWATAMMVAGAILLLHNTFAYLPFFSDDGFISLRYSERLLAGHGLTWNDGELVEGYSNLLWVLLCAALGWVGLDLVLAARLLGCATALGMLAALARHFLRPGQTNVLAGFAAILPLAATGALAVWTIGGMEAPLLTCLLAWALVLAFPLLGQPAPGERRQAVAVGVLLGLLAWTRPDGALWSPVVAVAPLLAHRDRRGLRLALAVAVIPAAFVVAQLGFRLAYYHAWVPNTALAKLAWTPERRALGNAYLAEVARAYWPLALLAVSAAPALRDPQARRRILLCLAGLLVWGGYVWAIGGDIFPGHRHALPLLLLGAFLAGEGVRWFAGPGKRTPQEPSEAGTDAGSEGRRRLPALSPRTRWAVAALLSASVAWGVDFLRGSTPANLRAIGELWEWGAVPMARLLRGHFPPDTLLAVDTAGALPYFTKLPTVDMLGLVDSYLSHHRPRDFGRSFIGHELGDGHYVRERKPDVILFCLPVGTEKPCFRSGRELVAQPDFLDDFELVTWDLPEGLLAKLWVRRTSPRLHSPRPDGRIEVPAYLMGHQGRLHVREVAGRPAVVLGDAPARASHLRLPVGHWEAGLSPAAPDAVLTAFMADGQRAQGRGSLRFFQRELGRVDIEIAAGASEPEMAVYIMTLSPARQE